jgi:hypothetical protein
LVGARKFHLQDAPRTNLHAFAEKGRKQNLAAQPPSTSSALKCREHPRRHAVVWVRGVAVESREANDQPCKKRKKKTILHSEIIFTLR